MRIITKSGTDIPYEAMGVAVVSVYLETVEDVKKRKGITHDASDDVFFTCLRERKKRTQGLRRFHVLLCADEEAGHSCEV